MKLLSRLDKRLKASGEAGGNVNRVQERYSAPRWMAPSSLSVRAAETAAGGAGLAAKLLQVFEDPIGGFPLAPEREAVDLADVGASSNLIVDFRHRAQAEICARCARPWPKEMFSPGIS
jgi:hypothetical protein